MNVAYVITPPLQRVAISESMGDMDRSDLQQLSKEQLIELVLRLQRPDKNSRTYPSRLRRIRRKSARTLALAEPSLGMSRATAGWRTIPTNFATTCRAFARRAAELFRWTPSGS